jgi:UDP-N-acetylglucosamine:LPS N-acetylglucosamine transferase
VRELLGDPGRLAAMAEASGRAGRPDATRRVADEVEELVAARLRRPRPDTGER